MSTEAHRERMITLTAGLGSGLCALLALNSVYESSVDIQWYGEHPPQSLYELRAASGYVARRFLEASLYGYAALSLHDIATNRTR